MIASMPEFTPVPGVSGKGSKGDGIRLRENDGGLGRIAHIFGAQRVEHAH